jgi:hypothetical protein
MASKVWWVACCLWLTWRRFNLPAQRSSNCIPFSTLLPRPPLLPRPSSAARPHRYSFYLSLPSPAFGNLAPTLLPPRVSHLVSAASWDPLAPSLPRCQPPCQLSRQLYKCVSSIPLPLPAFPLAIAVPHLPLLLFLLPFSHSFRPSMLPPALVAAIQ